MTRTLLTIITLLFINTAFSQQVWGTVANPSGIIFKDTTDRIVTDSLIHDVGNVPSRSRTLLKYFKYIGKKPGIISNAWTGDPYFISDYPTEPLQPGHIYTFKVNFCFDGGNGHFIKNMGLRMEDGTNIPFIFKGNIN